jgi:hypothetical protein
MLAYLIIVVYIFIEQTRAALNDVYLVILGCLSTGR